FFYERMAPLIEAGGVIFVTILAIIGSMSWMYYWIFFVALLLFSVLLSSIAIFAEELTYHQYKNKGDGLRLILTAFLEPIFFHPVVVYAAIRGNYDYYFVKNKHWGKMERKGLGKK
ncbi:MAG: glycosyltransferase family 2 protein, partial [Saprospiraceae bacterium]|nr:glycosyltransferase family 2 protein [Saprospiraceae bacterium]